MSAGQQKLKPAARGGRAKAKDRQTAEPMSLRIDAATRSLIDSAASCLGQTRTDFMLNSSRDRATEVLLSQTFVMLPKADWMAFKAMLESPPPPNAKLKALLARTPPWETR